MQLPSIPFNLPYVPKAARGYLADALTSGHLSGDGAFTRKASDKLSELTGAAGVLLTTSCTHALEMAALLLGVGPGDEVIMPSFTFVSTANAFALRGARPVFVDIRPDTFNLDERAVENAITPSTKAIIVVHYAGVACEMEAINSLAQKYGLEVVEDNAHGLGGSYHHRALGTFGRFATLSFHETKNIQCGEGGALLMNHESDIEHAEILREKGTNRTKFFRGQIDKYSWVSLGSSYLPSELNAAVLLAQLDEYDSIQARRLAVWEAYRSGLRTWAQEHGFEFQSYPSDRVHPAHLFALLAPTESVRSEFIHHMAVYGIMAVSHYVPLHSSHFGRQYGEPVLPVTDQVAGRLVRLPIYPDLGCEGASRVIDAVTRFVAAVPTGPRATH